MSDEMQDGKKKNERVSGRMVAEPQGKRKKGSSTSETQLTTIILGMVAVVGCVHIWERGTVRHPPTVVLVQWAMNSTILRQWVERLMHRAPFQSVKG